MKRVFLLLVALLLSVAVHSQSDKLFDLEEMFGNGSGAVTAGELVQYCRYGRPEDARQVGYHTEERAEGKCVGYLTGLVEVMRALGATNSVGLCIPEQFLKEFQASPFGDPFRSVFLGWVARHPESLEATAAKVTLDALSDAWPCVRLTAHTDQVLPEREGGSSAGGDEGAD